MNITRNMTLALLMAAALGAQAQTEVAPFVPGSTLEGISYFLPRTVFRVTVKADKKVTSMPSAICTSRMCPPPRACTGR